MPVITYREALRQSLRYHLTQDDRVFLLGEDIGAYGGAYGVTKGFIEEFGDRRIKDTPIAEAGIVGLATGAALAGLRPVAELMTINFSLVAFDQIVNEAAKFHHMFGGQMTVPMVIRMANGWGQLAATHSQTLETLYAHFPGLKVVMPATPYDAKGLLNAAIEDPDPVIFIEHSLIYGLKGEVPEANYAVPIGEAKVVREGQDFTVISWSRLVHTALKAAEQLSRDGIELEVVDLRTIRPLDTATMLRSVRKTHRAIVLEEDWKSFGAGAEVASRLNEQAFDDLDAPVTRLGAKEVPLPYSRPLEVACFPDEHTLIDAIKAQLPARFAASV